MQELADRFVAARRHGWFRSRPVLEHCKVPSEGEIDTLEKELGCRLPADMHAWLKIVGFCTLDDNLSFRSEWFRCIDEGALNGAVLFAQDTLGNFYGYVPVVGTIVFFSRSEHAYAVVAANFRAFLECLETRNYQVLDWVDSLDLTPYDWKTG